VTAALPELTSQYDVARSMIDAFGRDGHCVVPGLASREEADAYRPVIEAAVDAHRTEHRPLEERDTYGRAFVQVANLWRRSPEVARFVLSPRFASVAAALLGIEGVRLYHDQALFKEPGGGHTPLHQDQHYWPLDTDKTITMWMPLADLPPDVGNMSFASGSHRLGSLGELAISDESDAAMRRVIAERGLLLDTHGALHAGDATFHAGWTLHGAGDNPTGAPRPVMTVIYFADGARVIPPAHPFHDFDRQMWLRVDPGELAASDRNPLLWPLLGDAWAMAHPLDE
jgi:ectoine hydroxylase-related dioxygenase (phytanoyl-CoA dioxygenase family)